ncbi:DUF3231 family protein [Mesobacillus maritimus]|uniref:DUF3231 family protein n=1 Tax=Mesobacillus maritimus TaxID=1643336 RepID=A0ABS7KBJ7_9BACI|nr:DUF3231 family protein [Mesobacillus maritimus]MBY0099421.1 DUF3231 family protein [Mesobacillus maritimus]
MENRNIKLTTAEIATLWKTYIQNTAVRCFYKHFFQSIQDDEIKSIIEEVTVLVETIIQKVETIFEEENFPIPQGFSDKDIDYSAPALYTDLFALSFVYRGGQVIIPQYANNLCRVSRIDIYQFFEECLNKEAELHKKALNLMLSKGLIDRPPNMEYPKNIEFIQQSPSFINSLLGEKRPLNTIEITELFIEIERNAIGLIFLMGLIQVTKDKEIKNYLLKGKKLATKQVETFNKLLKENDHFVGFPITMEVTNSTVSPFSERLILFIISTSNQIAISALADALSVSMRKDLAAHYFLVLGEVMKYGDEGLKLLIERGWMEQPPQPIDRNEFYK